MITMNSSRKAINVISAAILLVLLIALVAGGLFLYRWLTPKPAAESTNTIIQVKPMALINNNSSAHLSLTLRNVGAKTIDALKVTLANEPTASLSLPSGGLQPNQTVQYANNNLDPSRYTVNYVYILVIESHCTDGSTASMLQTLNCTSS
jgi:hypothetical protein